MKRRIFAIITAILLLTSMAVPALAASTDQATLRHAVVRIYTGEVYNDAWDSFGEGSIGTGFFIGSAGEAPQYIITNYHVVADYIENHSGQEYGYYIDGELVAYAHMEVRIYFDENDYEQAYVVEADSVNDFAILRLAAPTDKRAALPISVPGEDMVGLKAYSVGFPAAADFVDPTEKWSETGTTVNSGDVSRLFTESGTGTPLIQTTAVFHPGNSGGPLVFENGAVIGITTRHLSGSSTSASIFYAVSMSVVKPVLDRNSIPYELLEYPESEVKAESFPTWAIIAIAAAAVAVIAVIAVLATRKKPAKASPAPVSPVGKTAPAPAPKKGDSDDSGFRVQGVSGAMEGKRFMIRASAPLVIGRDPAQCGMALPASTPGVSARHCAVWVEKGEVYVKDLGSSHGTFITPGRRLAAEQPVKIGEGEPFWLGSESESFVVAKKRVN